MSVTLKVTVDKNPGWIGVDLDGTLAVYTRWQGYQHIGKPIPLMMDRIKAWLAKGFEVRIFTARVADLDESFNATTAIHSWLATHGIPPLTVTCVKDMNMIALWDDRAVQVYENTGQRVGYVDHGKPVAL